ncbi:MAG: hypothetical protein AB7E85_07125 [Pseudobdellovibrionaceae bacterium]
MFREVFGENTLGIDVHKPTFYEGETDWLKARAMHDSTDHDFTLSVEPNYTQIEEIFPTARAHSFEFDPACSHSIGLGRFELMQRAIDEVMQTQNWLMRLAREKGILGHFLVEEGNAIRFHPDSAAKALSFGNTVRYARMARVFDQAVAKEPLTFQSSVGRIMPVFIRALGINEYYMKTHSQAEDVPVMNVQFIFPEAGMLTFYDYGRYQPAGIERYNYRDHDFHLTFSGEMKGDIPEKIVFSWLRDYAREGGAEVRSNMADYLDDPYVDLRQPGEAKLQFPSASENYLSSTFSVKLPSGGASIINTNAVTQDLRAANEAEWFPKPGQ